MFIQRTFSSETLETVRQFKRQSTWFARRLGQIQDDLPLKIASIEDRAAFKAVMPNRKHHEYFPFAQVFNTDGAPKNPSLAPLTEFCRIVLELERQIGFNQSKAIYDINGRTENANDPMRLSALRHFDGGDPLVRVYLLSDEVASTRFGLRNTTPFDIYFFSGITKHQAWGANPEFRDLPEAPRNMAHLRISGGVDNRLVAAVNSFMLTAGPY